MYKRSLEIDQDSAESLILFGPRGTGKTYWVKSNFPDALYFDLLDSSLYKDLTASSLLGKFHQVIVSWPNNLNYSLSNILHTFRRGQ